jgi:Domain of unknown function (DUF222)
MLECMFDEFQRLDDGGLLAAMSESLRVERAAVARRLIAAGLLAQRRVIDAEHETESWCVEDWDVAAAEIGAELGISRFRASADMSYGQTLIERLPKLAERFLAGDVDYRVFTVIDFRTALVSDPDVLAELDEKMARLAPGWNALSRKKLTHVIDWLVVELDPEARRIARERDDDRHIGIGPGQNGMAEVWGRLPAADGAALDTRLDSVAATVCPADPRTKAQRRADALMAVSEGAATLACACGTGTCPATGDPDAEAPAQVVLHVLAEQATVTGDSTKSGYLPGYGPIPAETVRELAQRARTKLRPLYQPNNPAPEPRYRPSAALAEFIRCRDITCRWVGCDVPAEQCDIDHTIPYPFGPTHPSNLKLYCRHHHLMKTFYTGPGGWTEVQLPDATMTLTSPSGRIHTTKPGASPFFPQLATPTGTLYMPQRPPPDSALKTLMMPTRRRSRTAEHAARIAWERGINRASIEANPPPF